MHPSPGRPEPDCGPYHQQGRGEKDASSEAAVEPASEEEKDQRRHDDGPAEHPDLTQPGTERRLRDLTPALGALERASRNMGQGVRVARSRSILFERGHDAASS